mmetsp:Transcript_47273/g.110183  ORF Transcript_47273/g.110183 Transcript_47273/m.110183 type:complete len:86 (-) Transcript_47273:563-820(-)
MRNVIARCVGLERGLGAHQVLMSTAISGLLECLQFACLAGQRDIKEEINREVAPYLNLALKLRRSICPAKLRGSNVELLTLMRSQ